MKKDKALRFMGGTLIVLGLGMEYIVASTDQDYVNAPSRNSVIDPTENATSFTEICISINITSALETLRLLIYSTIDIPICCLNSL